MRGLSVTVGIENEGLGFRVRVCAAREWGAGDIFFCTLTTETTIGTEMARIAPAITLTIVLSDSPLTVPTLVISYFEEANARIILSSTQCLAFLFVGVLLQDRYLASACHPVTGGPRL